MTMRLLLHTYLKPCDHIVPASIFTALISNLQVPPLSPVAPFPRSPTPYSIPSTPIPATPMLSKQRSVLQSVGTFVHPREGYGRAC